MCTLKYIQYTENIKQKLKILTIRTLTIQIIFENTNNVICKAGIKQNQYEPKFNLLENFWIDPNFQI